jgi:prephenate dehydratase
MRPLKVAIQGIAASYHHEATKLYFKEEVEIVECNTFKNVCERLKKNDIDYAVMAIENSIAGSILANYNLIKNYRFFIMGEIYMHIGFHLLANKDVSLKDVRYVESHPMALAQCTEFLSQYPHISVVSGDDTASSAKKIQEGNFSDRATIAGLGAASLYNLEVLEHNIEDTKQNYTRFLIISKHCPYEENSDKSTISFQLPHSLGQLADVLDTIAHNRANLTKIQSVPVIGKPDEYTFFLDMEWDSADEHANLLMEIEQMTKNFSVLGWYKKNSLALSKAQNN